MRAGVEEAFRPGTSFGSYLQLPEVTNNASSPPASDCNSSNLVGRLVLQDNGKGKLTLWGCNSLGEWAEIK